MDFFYSLETQHHNSYDSSTIIQRHDSHYHKDAPVLFFSLGLPVFIPGLRYFGCREQDSPYLGMSVKCQSCVRQALDCVAGGLADSHHHTNVHHTLPTSTDSLAGTRSRAASWLPKRASDRPAQHTHTHTPSRPHSQGRHSCRCGASNRLY